MNAPHPMCDPASERARLLAPYGLLDTPPEERFDRITRHAAWAFDAPICLISLVDDQRQWFKSRHGLDLEETPREVAFCDHTIRLNDIFVVEDTHADARFVSNPFVTGPSKARFYAGAPIRTRTGECLGALCILDTVPRTLTPRQCAALADLGRIVEEELERSRVARKAVQDAEHAQMLETRFRHMVQNGSDVISLLRADGTIVYQSTSIERILGYPPAALVGLDVFTLIHPDDADAARAAFFRVVETGESLVHAFRFRTHDGAWTWMEAAVANFLDDPTVGSIVANSRDITERRRADARLRESEGRYRALSELVSTFAFSYAVDAQGHAALEWVTDSVGEVLGYTPAELVGSPWGQFVESHNAAQVHQHLDEVLGGATRTDVARMKRKDGRLRWYRIVSHPEWNDDHTCVVRVYGAAQDVTAEQEHERELTRARDRAEEMNRLKDAFLANMSHEIRTPLTSIIGFSDILASEIEGEHRELAQMICQSGERLNVTLDAVLELARLESGQVQMKPETADLAALARDVTASFQHQAHEKALALTYVPPAAPVEALVDRSAAARILHSLLSNAVKFTHKGRVSVSAGEERGQAWMRVEDTGVGISPGFLPHLFDEFTQESSGLARRYEGSGLGLTITKKLLDLLGGTLGVESEPGRGSAFTVYLPVPVQR